MKLSHWAQSLGARRVLAAALALGALTGCATAPVHPVLVAAQSVGTLPPLVPVRRFVANVDAEGGYQISPDGQRLLWQKTVGLDVGLAVRGVAPGAPETAYATGNMGRSGGFQAWLADSRHIVFSKDPTGDENTQLWVQDTHSATLAPWAVVMQRGVRSGWVGRGPAGGATFFFVTNQRDRSTFDLYEADAQTRTVREVARSDGSVQAWLLGEDQRLAGRTRLLGKEDGADLAMELLQPDGQWKRVKTVGGFDSYWVHRIDTATGLAWVTHNLGRDKTALFEVNLTSGAERVLASNAVVDLSFPVLPAGTGAPVGVVAAPGYPELTWLDPVWQRDVDAAVQKAMAQRLLVAAPIITRPQSMSHDNQRVVLRSTDLHDTAELLLDRSTGTVTRLDPPRGEASTLFSPDQPFSFRASDGRTIHGYVVRPLGVSGPAPMVVEIHGGPWARDNWQSGGFNTDQLLANRGYAVLRVNYRGSHGYGRDHLWAADREYFGRLQQDIAEGVQWAVDQGIADPKRLAVFGGSFGGFSTLAQLILKPHDYRCGIDVVGVANWPRVVDNWPPFWRNRHWFARTFGDVNNPQDRAQMLANSPVSHLDAITAPLLVIHGGNDVRVLKADSDDVVNSLRQRGHPVEYLLFENEGHSISKWRNRLAMWRKVEDTLATCLGGRSNGFDFFELMPR